MQDWWERRELQRQLAQELNYANARFRVANMKLRDGTAMVSRQLAFAASDSRLLLEQAHRECNAARAAFFAALERWKYFAIHGELSERKSASTSVENASPPAA